MSYRFYKNGKLKDDRIIAAIRQAADDYEDGAIIEAKDLLEKIVLAIDNWEYDFVNEL